MKVTPVKEPDRKLILQLAIEMASNAHLSQADRDVLGAVLMCAIKPPMVIAEDDSKSELNHIKGNDKGADCEHDWHLRKTFDTEMIFRCSKCQSMWRIFFTNQAAADVKTAMEGLPKVGFIS